MHLLTPRALVAVVLAVGALAGCGDDEGTSSTPTTTEEDTPADAIEVTAIDYSYEDLPSEIDSGTALALRNSSAAELHELVALRLPDDETRSVEELLAVPMEELEALFAAPPALVVVAPPGEEGFAAVGNGTLTEAGRYAVVCFIPIGADPQAYLDALEANPGQPPQVDGGPPHFTSGMAAELTVS